MCAIVTASLLAARIISYYVRDDSGGHWVAVHRHIWPALVTLLQCVENAVCTDIMIALLGTCICRADRAHGHDYRSLTFADHVGWLASTVVAVHAIASTRVFVHAVV